MSFTSLQHEAKHVVGVGVGGGWMETEPLILNEGRDEREHVVVVQNLHKLRRRREVVG